MEQEILVDDEIFVVYDLLTPEECDEFIEESHDEGFSQATVTSAQGDVLVTDYRNNQRVILDREDWAELLWERIQALELPWQDRYEPSGLNERFRSYLYRPGDYFAPHYDGHYERPDGSERSYWTILLYLNEGYQGGETAFPDHDLIVTPEKGMGLFFYHGLLHEGVEVLRGEKNVLRTDLMFAIDDRWHDE